MDGVLAGVDQCMDECPEFNLDDGLWVYAYEPNCQKARQLVYRECGVTTKTGLMAWCETHGHDEQRAALMRALG